LGNPNTVTRLAFVFSALNLHSSAIDAFRYLTIDKAIFVGHVYMDKAPGLSLMALPAPPLAFSYRCPAPSLR